MSRDPHGRKISRNATCWCGSGKKFKNCHYNREIEIRPHPRQAIRRFYDLQKKTAFCSCDFDAERCTKQFVRAHSISKEASLAQIANGGHVQCFEIDPESSAYQGVSIVQKGINHASVVRAFCSFHDHLLFGELDKMNLGSPQTFFWQLFYRTVCFERYLKLVATQNASIMRGLDAGSPGAWHPYWQDYVSRHKVAHSLGFDSLSRLKVLLERQYLEGFNAELYFRYFTVSGRLPFAGTGVFQPDLTPNGNKVQKVNQFYKIGQRFVSPRLEHICMSILPSRDQTILSFCALRDHNKAITFVEDFLGHAGRCVDSFIGLAILKMENLFFEPSFLASLPEPTVRRMKALHSYGVGEDVRLAEMRQAMQLRLFPGSCELPIVSSS